MDYLFWRKNNIIAPDQGRDPYPWIIWYIWKARNDKLFKGIDRDPFELVRYAESECQAWFNANETIPPHVQATNNDANQVLSLVERTYNLWEHETSLDVNQRCIRRKKRCDGRWRTCFNTRRARFGTDCKELIAMINEPQEWPRFATELEKIETLQICFPDFKITHVPRVRSQLPDFLAKTARSFRRELLFIDGSWTASDRFSGCGWVWMDSREDIQLMGTRNFTRCESALHSEVEALRWAMENMLQHSPCQSFGTDCKELIAMINEPQEWPRFATELEKIETLQICFPDFKITHVPRVRSQLPDFLAKTARSFRRELLFIGCSILVWLPRTPQV
ncbi:hypothetical protein F2Q69_00037547 [Brassica cretica]|uniref:RNase H type-1 domain-containing protein n=1 Tax=Brassica cretica TaxID=69181 RepID=A0A8S9SLV4_BRACR|nr:hypothetical protein F2Q69_00037547 [Brassica cretica]